MRTPNVFIDPSTGDRYEWPLNHTSEDSLGKHRNIRFSAPTGHEGLIKQQADDEPMYLRWKGTILERSQHVAFLRWWQKCATRTIQVQDFQGNIFEVLISYYDPVRKGVARNLRDPTGAPNNVWDYTLEMLVISFISGDYADAGVVP